MKTLTGALLTCLALALSGCYASAKAPSRQHIPSEVKVDAPVEGRPTLAMPLQLPESSVFVTPFTVDRPKRWLENSDRFETSKMSAARANSRYAYEQEQSAPALSRNVRWHNAIVGTKDGRGQLVLDRKGIISKLDVVGPWIEVEDPERKQDDPIEWKFVPKAVLMLATTQDTDGDGQLTASDANILLAGGPNAEKLHPITPLHTQVWSTAYNADQDLIILMIVSDTDGDGRFTVADSAAPYVYTPGSPGGATPLVDPRLVSDAERLLK